MLSKNSLFLAGVFVLFFSAVFFSTYWHDLAVKEPVASFALYSFEKVVGSQACFELMILPENISEEFELRAYLDSKPVLREKIWVDEKTRKEFCIDAGNKEPGDYFVEVFLNEKRLFYSIEKTDNNIEMPVPEINIEGFEENLLKFSVSGFPIHLFHPIEIFVNGDFERAVYPFESEQFFEEKIFLEEGLHEITVKALSEQETIEAEVSRQKSSLFLGLIAILIGLAVFMLFVFPKEEFFAKIALSIAALFSLLIFSGLLLGFFNLFKFPEFPVFYCIILLAVLFLFRKNFQRTAPFSLKSFLKSLSFEAFLAFAFFVFIAVFFGLFIPSHSTHFNIFYERGTMQLIENAGLPETDELSYLGRPFTFIPGYFFIQGGLSLLSGLEGRALFALTVCFAVFFFLFSSIAFARKIGLKNSNFLFPIFLSMGTFVFTSLIITPRHAIAFAFLLVSLLLLLRKQCFATTASLFVSFIIQIPNIAFFLITAPVVILLNSVKGFKEIKGMLMPFLASFALFCILYAVLFWHAGLPFQTHSTEWGYLISLGLFFVLGDPGLLFFFFVFLLFAELYFLVKGKAKFTRNKKILFIACIALIFLQSTVSSRLPVITAFFMALFCCYFIESYAKKFNEFFPIMLGFIVLMGLNISILLAPGFSAAPETLAATQFLKNYSGNDEVVLADPYYSHLIAFHSQRKTVADLMVEYADPEQLADAYAFLQEKDYEILEKYNAGIVFSKRFLINKSVLEREELEQELKFRELSKIFVNEKLSIHRKTH